MNTRYLTTLTMPKNNAPFLPLKPIPMKDRISMIFLQYGQLDVKDGAFVLIDKTGVRTHIPVGSIACIYA